ncbi:MAG: TolC family outer membrane protein [Chlorobiaceae bacterium]|nr:TolC family outer membrane protein [Chlorobiaceae bacterium]
MKILKKTTVKVAVSGLMLLSAGFASCSEAKAITVKEAVEKAVNNSPEIKARFHAFRDVYEEQQVAKGGYFPKIDLSAGIGREVLQGDKISSTNMWRKDVRLDLKQMLFDGFFTRNQVCSLKYSGQARYFEFMDTVENIGLESLRAYVDVLRYREMVNLSKRNLDYHREIYNQVSSRVKAGVGAGVDLQQISARVALAQANYLTELSNLNDVKARYQRYTGEVPDENMQAVLLPDDGIPVATRDVLNNAFQHNSGFLATMSDIKSARHLVKVQESKLYPRIDLKAWHDRSWDVLGVEGQQSATVAEVALTYNIFNGGSGRAAVHQYREKMFRAIDLKDKAANDIRQAVAIACNDRRMIAEQIVYLNQHRKNLDEVRVAYRDQFNIGKRTLLDLLDTENEYYQSQRAYYNGFFDLTITNAKTLALMGRLMNTMGVVRAEMPSLKDIDVPFPNVTESDIPSTDTPAL